MKIESIEEVVGTTHSHWFISHWFIVSSSAKYQIAAATKPRTRGLAYLSGSGYALPISKTIISHPSSFVGKGSVGVAWALRKDAWALRKDEADYLISCKQKVKYWERRKVDCLSRHRGTV